LIAHSEDDLLQVDSHQTNKKPLNGAAKYYDEAFIGNILYPTLLVFVHPGYDSSIDTQFVQQTAALSSAWLQ
jgi:hypothetical protein